MIQYIRIVGFLLIIAGALVLLSYVWEPLRAFWPWVLQLPLPIRFGLGLAVFGFLLLIGSVIHERLQDLRKEESLLDD